MILGARSGLSLERAKRFEANAEVTLDTRDEKGTFWCPF